jgi:hypothetical protein
MNIKNLDIIGAGEVCKICNFSNQYLKFLVFKGTIPAKKVSNNWIFLRSDILKFQKKREENAKTDKRVKFKE